MKNFLKKHGKKVSVGLLATALMVSPMMPVVNASDSDTCEINYNYYFLEAENAWIDSQYTGPKYTYDSTSDTWADSGEDITITQRSYTTQYAMHYGISDSDYDAISATPDGTSLGLSAGDRYVNGAGAIFNGTENSKGTNFTKKTNLTMTSEATFFNNQLPEGYKGIKNVTVSSWTDEDWNNYFDMYIKALHVAKGKESDIKVDDAIFQDGDNYHFIHTAWKNTSSSETGNGGYLSTEMEDWRSSDETGTLSTMINGWAADETISKETIKNAKVKAEIEKLKKASVKIADSKVTIDHMGDANLYPTVNAIITRSYGTMSKPTAFWSVTVDVPQDDSSANALLASSEVTTKDTYNWYFMPAKTTITFQASGDVCKTAGTPVENTGVNNEKTGVASYAIIGTLLVGAGSAYIYARKNNKFSKL